MSESVFAYWIRYHGLVVEREALHGTQGVGGTADLLEDDEGLAPHLQAPRHQDIQDLAKLGEDGIQGLLELIFLDLLIEIVDINSVVGTGLGNCHGVRCSGTPKPSLRPTAPAKLRCKDTQLLSSLVPATPFRELIRARKLRLNVQA